MTLDDLNRLERSIKSESHHRAVCTRAAEALAERRRGFNAFAEGESEYLVRSLVGTHYPPKGKAATALLDALKEALPDIYRAAELTLAAESKRAGVRERLYTSQLEAALSAIPEVVP